MSFFTQNSRGVEKNVLWHCHLMSILFYVLCLWEWEVLQRVGCIADTSQHDLKNCHIFEHYNQGRDRVQSNALQTIFYLCISKKKADASLTPKCQLNICKSELKYSLGNYDIPLRSTVLDAAIQLSINIFQKELWITVVILWRRFIFFGLELQWWSLEFVYSFSKVYIWNLGIWLIPFRIM